MSVETVASPQTDRGPDPLSTDLKTVVVVSPYFPPSTLAGVHRARHLAKHLPACGWRPVVLCVDEADHENRPDPPLAALVPPTAELVKVRALPVAMSRRAGLGDISLRAWRSLRSGLIKLMESRPFDAVLITGSPYYPMLFAGEIRRRFGVPVVLDFQDPWVSDHGASQNPWSKAGWSHRLACALEPRAVRHASFITSVSETQNAQMAARYAWTDASRMAAIPIGGDPADFEALRTPTQAAPSQLLRPGLIHLSYVGTFLPHAAPLVRTLFRALSILREMQPGLESRLQVNFIGTSNQPGYRGPGLVEPLAAAERVSDLVYELPDRIPFLDALGVLANSTGLLLIGSDEIHYTASKIYPALMSGRPFVSLFHSQSSAHRILSAAGGGCPFGFADTSELPPLAAPLAEALVRLATNPESLGRADPAVYEPYSARSVAARFAEVFDRAAR